MTDISKTVYYFGCVGQCGHFLHHPETGRVRPTDREVHPWGYDIDGGIFQGSKQAWTAGLVHIQSKDGWTGISFADYSIDTRPGSHSTFVVEGEFSEEEILLAAKKQWPQIFGRPRFPQTTLIKKSDEP